MALLPLLTAAQDWQAIVRADSVYIASLETENGLLRKKASLDSTAAATKFAAYDVALKTANTEIGYQTKRGDQLATKNETLGANLDECNSQLETAKDELYRYKPKTKVGVLLRKIRNGLAIVGGVTVGITIIRLLPL